MTDKPIRVDLTPFNLVYAGLVGVSRQVKGVKKKGTYGVKNFKDGWQNNCDGATGECAIAKWLNVFWDGALGDFRAKDVGGRYQARTTPYDWGDMILHPDDADDDVFILVLSHNAPAYYLKGWVYGREGKLEKYWRDGEKNRPAFFVPQGMLEPMSTLPGLREDKP